MTCRSRPPNGGTSKSTALGGPTGPVTVMANCSEAVNMPSSTTSIALVEPRSLGPGVARNLMMLPPKTVSKLKNGGAAKRAIDIMPPSGLTASTVCDAVPPMGTTMSSGGVVNAGG